MANTSSIDETSAWINKLTKDISACKYGRNYRSIVDGIAEQKSKSDVIRNNEDKIKILLNRTRDVDKKKSLEAAFNNLKMISEKKLHCLQTMLAVSTLESKCSIMSRDLDQHALAAVREIQQHQQLNKAGDTGEHLAGFISASAQDCIFGLRDNWDWIRKLVKCVDVHLKNGAEYHQFFHEVDESEEWLHDDLSRVAERFENRELKGSEEDSRLLAAELDETYLYLKQWEAKTNRLWDMATKLVPLPRRTDGSNEPVPALNLCDYETHEISLRSNEDILLLDNRNEQMWRVRNGRGEEAEVPAVIVLIPGPDKQAIDAAINMRLRLLTTWTNALKKIGKKLIFFMLHVFKHEYKPDEIAAITSIQDLDKSKMLQILNVIEDGLKRHWSDHEGFINLQERILALRMALEEFGDGQQSDERLTRNLILQVTTLGEIIKIYQDMIKDWELYKVSVEASRAPELMLIVDKWEQLQFVTREFFSKFWKSNLNLNEKEKLAMKPTKFVLDGVQYEDIIQYEDATENGPQRNSVFALESVTSDAKGQAFTAKISSVNGVDPFPAESVSSIRNSDSRFSKLNSATANYVGVNDEEVTTFGRAAAGTQPVFKTIENDYGHSHSAFVNVNSANEHSFGNSSVQQTVSGRPYTVKTADLINDHGGNSVEANSVKYQNANANVQSNQINSSLTSNRETLYDNTARGDYKQTKVIETVSETEKHSAGSSDINQSRDVLSDAESWLEERDKHSFNTVDVTGKREYTDGKGDIRGTSDEGSSGHGSYEKTIHTESKSDDKISKQVVVPKPVLRPQVVHANVQEEGFEEIKEINIKGVYVGEHVGTDFGVATERKTSETEQLCSAEMEEKKTFIIRSVINPADKSDISLEQAIMLGIICPNKGQYVNTVTGEVTPLASAMSDGLIKVIYTTVKRSPEKTSTIGIITVKTIREVARPYEIKSIKDTIRGDAVSQKEAVKRGIFDEVHGTFLDRRTSKRMLTSDAVEAGFVEVEYIGAPPADPVIISKVYAVRAVVDRRQKRTVTFQEAIRAGIIDKESGAYRDNLTGEKMYVGDAIMRGFLKARLLESSFGLNIDPENRLVIDKTDIIRKNLLRPLGVISAFKRAVREGNSPKK